MGMGMGKASQEPGKCARSGAGGVVKKICGAEVRVCVCGGWDSFLFLIIHIHITSLALFLD